MWVKSRVFSVSRTMIPTTMLPTTPGRTKASSLSSPLLPERNIIPMIIVSGLTAQKIASGAILRINCAIVVSLCLCLC